MASCVKMIQKARSSDDFNRIDTCIQKLQLVPKSDCKVWIQQRRLKLELWLKAIDKIDRTIDKNFDPSDAPQINISPPVGAGLRAGVSPIDIKDPKLRKQYEEALKVNKQKADRYRLQHALRRLDKIWSTQVLVYRKSNYTSKAEDVKEIHDLIDKVLSSSQRKKQMKKELLGINEKKKKEF